MDHPNSKPKLVGNRQPKNNFKLKDDKEAAAIKIQAAFRGHYTRKEIEATDENNEVINKKKLQYIPKKNKTESHDKVDNEVDLTSRTQYNDKVRKEERKPIDKLASKEHTPQYKNDSKSNKTKMKTNVSRKYSLDEKEILYKEKAAIIIQASFRGYKTRQSLQRKSSRIQYKSTVQYNNKKFASKINKRTDDNDDLEKAAITIQAGFRGYLARQNMYEKSPRTRAIHKTIVDKKKDSNEDLNKAAAKIQASFRSYRARNMNQKGSRKETTEEHNIDREKAAIQIQAGFRGFKARKERKEKEKAAEKIQAGYRSYKVRKELEKKSSEKPKNDENFKDKDVLRNNAASKIQAAFRSYVVRKGNV